jgi:DNA-binding HxlR family transcriptional regulator
LFFASTLGFVVTRKRYGQFCGLARALDHVGDRWTLLVVRELLLGPKRFAELQTALPGMASNVLVDRLRALEADGLVARSPHPPRSAAVTYSLTEVGRGVEPAILALIRWGAHWMATGPGDDRVDPAWAVLALRALLADTSVRAPRGEVVVAGGGKAAVVRIDAGGRRVEPAPEATTAEAGDTRRRRRPRATVTGELPALLAVVVGGVDLVESGLAVRGDEAFAAAVLSAAPVGPRGRAGSERS